MIDLYSFDTPNGWKASLMLDECELAYEYHEIDLTKGDQKTPDFLKKNPNGRIPALHDRETGVTIFESGAILLYLAEKTGRFLPQDPAAKSQVMQWVMFQMSGVGPMQGQANVFYRYFPEKIPSVIQRYHNETNRLYGVLDDRLGESAYLGGDEVTIADMCTWPWIIMAFWAGLETEPFQNLQRWRDELTARPKWKPYYDRMQSIFVERGEEILATAQQLTTR